jgi:hypothetical protein
MRLIKLTLLDNCTIWIVCSHIVAIEQGTSGTRIWTNCNKYFVVSQGYKEVTNQLDRWIRHGQMD